MDITILGIESSCDDTSAAVIRNNLLLSNVIASQAVHIKYGGVIPELASRAHQQNIIPVVDTALREAGLTVGEIDAIAFTRGPGLLGSLLVGVSFAKGALGGARHPDGRGQPPEGHILFALHRPARPRTAPSGLSVPVPAGQRRAYADRTRGFAARYGDHRHDDRRRRRRSVRQMRQSHGPALPRRPGDRPSGQGGRSEGIPLRASPRRGLRLFVLGPENLVPLHAARRRGRRPRFHRAQQGRPLRVAPEHDRGDPARQTGTRRRRTRASATSPSPGAYRPTRDCATASSSRAAGAAGERSFRSSSSRPTTRR